MCCVFGLILNSAGSGITEAPGVRVRDVRAGDGWDRERLVPLPKDFGQVFGFWLSDRPKDDFLFAKEPGRARRRVPTPSGGYLRRLLDRAGLDKKVTPHKLRHTYATRLLEAGAELVDIQRS